MAALLMLYAAQAVGAPVTAEQALAASRAMTGIGPDPCRRGSSSDEIVVCARRSDSPYTLPLYDAPLRDETLLSGRGREDAVETARESAAPCHARGEPCTTGLPVLRVRIDGSITVGAPQERR